MNEYPKFNLIEIDPECFLRVLAFSNFSPCLIFNLPLQRIKLYFGIRSISKAIENIQIFVSGMR